MSHTLWFHLLAPGQKGSCHHLIYVKPEHKPNIFLFFLVGCHLVFITTVGLFLSCEMNSVTLKKTIISCIWWQCIWRHDQILILIFHIMTAKDWAQVQLLPSFVSFSSKEHEIAVSRQIFHLNEKVTHKNPIYRDMSLGCFVKRFYITTVSISFGFPRPGLRGLVPARSVANVFAVWTSIFAIHNKTFTL